MGIEAFLRQDRFRHTILDIGRGRRISFAAAHEVDNHNQITRAWQQARIEDGTITSDGGLRLDARKNPQEQIVVEGSEALVPPTLGVASQLEGPP